MTTTDNTNTSGVDLDAIRDREATATRGPWSATDRYPHVVFQDGGDYMISTNLARDPRADGAFIAHAREDIPALLAEVERLTGALTNARAVASDRIADRDKICRDVMAERDQVRAELDHARRSRFEYEERVSEQVENLRDQLEAIRALHTESPAGFCPSCYRANDVSDTDDGLVAWPCPTLQAMGITAGALSR